MSDSHITALRQEVDRLDEQTKSVNGFQSKALWLALAQANCKLAEALFRTGKVDDLGEAAGAFSDAAVCFVQAGQPQEGQKVRTRAHHILVMYEDFHRRGLR